MALRTEPTGPGVRQISIVSTVDAFGQPLEVEVMGSPESIRSELTAGVRAWARFGTPGGRRVYLHRRDVHAVSSAPEFQRFSR